MQKIKHFFTRITHRMFQAMKLSTSSAIIIGAIIIAISHVGYGFLIAEGGKAPLQLFNGRAVDDKDFIIGDKKSDVYVVEYSDTECVFCNKLHPTMKKLEQEYKNKVAFVYRYFPLTQIHPGAFDEAKSLYCVGKTLGAEKHNEYVDAFFNAKTQNNNMVLSLQGRQVLLNKIGINDEAYNSCMNNQESSAFVESSISDGVNAGVQGTPATFVLVKTRKGFENVQLIDGARPYEYFKTVIEEALSR